MLEKIDLETAALGGGPRWVILYCVFVEFGSLTHTILAPFVFVLVMLERHQRESHFPYRRVGISGGSCARCAAHYPGHVSREAVLQEQLHILRIQYKCFRGAPVHVSRYLVSKNHPGNEEPNVAVWLLDPMIQLAPGSALCQYV